MCIAAATPIALSSSAQAAAYTDQPLTPATQLAPKSEQATPHRGKTVVGELRTVDSSLSYAVNGRRQVITHPGAQYIKVHFDSLRLAPGESVTVASEDGAESYTYRSDPTKAGARGNAGYTTDGSAGFWAMSIDGDTAVVTLRTAKTSGGTVATIDRFWRGYTEAEIDAHNPAIESVCSTDARRDVVCYQSSHPTEYAKSRAVARILFNGSAHCTAWRVGNTNRMLTNNHCTGSQADLNNQEIQFDYQCATCGGNNPGAGTKVTGDTMLETSGDGGSGLDYTVFSVDNFDTITSFGTLYLDPRAPVAGERIYIIGHGDGDPKELSLYNNTQNDPNDVCKVNNATTPGATHNFDYMCDTSGGSSGSPVFSADHKVIGLHHLGGCPNEAAKISLVYAQISDLIDNTPPTGQNDFSVGVSPSSGSVTAGSSVSTTVSTATIAGNAQSVALSATGLPTGATATFNPTTVTSGASSTLSIATTSATPAGSYPIAVKGTATSGSKTATYTLTVNGPSTPGCDGTNGTDVAITDNATVSSSIPISGCAGNASATATVAVTIQHTYIGDLKVDLVAPDGTVYVLHNRTGGSADNINQTYTVNLSSEAANGTWKLQVNDNASQDTGKIDTWTLKTGGGGTTPSCQPQTNGTDVAITDNATVSSSITIAGCTGNASATSKVAVTIQHTYIGDLKVDLVAPDGTVYVLHNRTGGSADNINTTYTVNLSSEARNGAWKLQVNDNAAQDTGKIDTWTLTL
ncbi:proprotein convertase P-domain-containing protein [Nocardioides speluncae]|uniref:proprotein convertase P-domain-containing protein n=1 Tax=Nocardioides speluncae TaxID=2670337 RepID=UPI00197ED58D|nr:proprotein convertase P-domain-containing protein [Nocardioides speluncae]